MGCSTTNGGSGVESGVQGYQISPDSGRENIFAYLEHEFGNLTVYGQAISGEAEFTSKGKGDYSAIPRARARTAISRSSAATRSFPRASKPR